MPTLRVFKGTTINKRNLYHYCPHCRNKFLEDAAPTLPVGYKCRGRFVALWPDKKEAEKRKWLSETWWVGRAFLGVTINDEHNKRREIKARWRRCTMPTRWLVIRRLSEEKNHKRIPYYVKLIIACKGSDDVRWIVIQLKVYIATWYRLYNDEQWVVSERNKETEMFRLPIIGRTT